MVYKLGEVVVTAVIGDIIRLTDTQTYLSQEVLNTYFFRVEDNPTAGYLTGLITEFKAVVFPAVRPLQHQLLLHESLTAENLFSGDFLESAVTPALAGTNASGSTVDNALPSYVALSFLLQRENSRVRNGRKSIAGVPDNNVSGNAVNLLTNELNAFAAVLDNTLIAGAGADQFRPVIVGRIPYLTASGRQAYRLPVSQVEMAANWSYVVSARPAFTISSQVSRKQGNGQ
jgi:hypothetical protein